VALSPGDNCGDEPEDDGEDQEVGCRHCADSSRPDLGPSSSRTEKSRVAGTARPSVVRRVRARYSKLAERARAEEWSYGRFAGEWVPARRGPTG
jgi:hypothetical protein